MTMAELRLPPPHQNSPSMTMMATLNEQIEKGFFKGCKAKEGLRLFNFYWEFTCTVVLFDFFKKGQIGLCSNSIHL